MGRRHPLSLRLSASFEAFLREIGGNQRQSALLRALALIGADSLGYDLAVAQRDLHEALKAELPAPVAAALLDIAARSRRLPHVSHSDAPPAALAETDVSRTAADAAAAAPDDPFASVGFTFD
jgi:hypothetical protein